MPMELHDRRGLSPEQPASHSGDSTDEQLPPPVLGNHNQSTINARAGKRQRELEWIDISCLIINKMIGSGIFVSSAMVVLLAGSKLAALLMWIFGACYSFASIPIYLEYGLAWPFNGGEYIYVSKILPRPSIVAQCSFAWFFVCFSTSAGNAITFARFVGFATNPDHALLPKSLEGFTFIINIYTYGHSILNLTLAFGVLFPILVHRMNAYSTATADRAVLFPTEMPWSWQILRSGPIRQICAGFLILVNIFLVVLPFIPNAYTDGTPRKIPTWKLPVTSFPAYTAGAVAGFLIVFISKAMSFHNSHVVAGSVIPKNFVIPARRRWEIQYPEFGTYWQSIQDRGGIRATITETKMRLLDQGEAQTAREINQATGGRVQEPMHGWNVFRKWLHSRRTHRGSTVLSPPLVDG